MLHHVTLHSVVEHPPHPAEHVIGDGRGATLDDGLQELVNVQGLDGLHRQLAKLGFDVSLDTAAEDVRVFPSPEDHPLKIFIG